MMLTWRVFSDDNVQGELVTAEKIYINDGNGMIFSVKAVEPEPLPEVTPTVKPKLVKTGKWKPKAPRAAMITLRAYNAGAWSRVELVP